MAAIGGNSVVDAKPGWQKLGGACCLIAVRTLGAGAVLALLVSAQLVVSITADKLGGSGYATSGSAPAACSAWRSSWPGPS